MDTKLPHIISICEKAKQTGDLSREEIISLLQCPDSQASIIFDAANEVREREMGNDVHLRGLIEFSNYCKRICVYCGLRAGIADLKRYRMEIDAIVAAAQNAESLGYRSVVLQSGEDPYYTADRIAKVVDGIKNTTDLAVTLSCGEYSKNDYKIMKDAGADRYLLRFETSDEKLYRFLHPDSELKDRLSCLYDLGALDFQVGSGFMVGLPGETAEIAADNLLLLKELDVDMAGIGPFIPNPQTPIAHEKGGTLLESLKAVAIARLLLRNAHIPATTAMGSLDPRGREKALEAGANVVMPNVTPLQYRELYQLYPNKICLTDDPVHCRGCITGKIVSLGRNVAKDQGHSLKKPTKQSNNKEK